MAVLEGLDFKNFRTPPSPPSLRIPVVIGPHFRTRAPRSLCKPTNLNFLKPTHSMQHQTYSTWKIKFPSKVNISDLLTLLVTPAYVLKMQGMAVLEGPDFKISRGGMPPDPPRGSRLPTLGPLLTNFLDPPLRVSHEPLLSDMTFDDLDLIWFSHFGISPFRCLNTPQNNRPVNLSAHVQDERRKQNLRVGFAMLVSCFTRLFDSTINKRRAKRQVRRRAKKLLNLSNSASKALSSFFRPHFVYNLAISVVHFHWSRLTRDH